MKMLYFKKMTGQASRSQPWPQIFEIRTFFSTKKLTIFQGPTSKFWGPTSKMGATPTEMGVTPPGVNKNHPIHAPTSLGGPGGPWGGPGGPWGPMGALGPMGPWAPWARCAAGMREAQFTLVGVVAASFSSVVASAASMLFLRVEGHI